MSEVPKICGTLGLLSGVVDPLERRPFTSRVTTPNLVVLGQTEWGYLRSYFRKIWPFASRLSRSLKSVKPTRIDRLHDFLLVIHINHGPVSYRFQDKRWFRSKIAKYSYLAYLTPPLKGSHWNFVKAVAVRNTRMMCMWIHLDIIPAVRRTDNGQNW